MKDEKVIMAIKQIAQQSQDAPIHQKRAIALNLLKAGYNFPALEFLVPIVAREILGEDVRLDSNLDAIFWTLSLTTKVEEDRLTHGA